MTTANAIRLKLLATTCVLLAACSTTPRPMSNVDPGADFTAYRTYGFLDRLSTDNETYESLVSNFLKVAVAQEFDKRGFEYAESPDLAVNFYIKTSEQLRTRNVPTTSAYYGWRDPFYDTWGGYGGYETQVDQFTEGTLHIDVIDTATNQLVWEGAVSGRVTDDVIANLEKSIDKAVKVTMSAFPVPPGG